MPKIAFYAALKSPNHPVASGERTLARNLMKSLHRPGCEIDLVSEFRPLDKVGNADRQAAFIAEAEVIANGLVAKGDWDAWVSYHSYYKAPDLLGPYVSKALDIPYVSIEATRASKRLGGPWDRFERKAAAACDAADILFHFTDRDAVALRRELNDEQKLVSLPPFLAREDLPAVANPVGPTILIAGMMRSGDKLKSYEIAASALAHLKGDWRVEIAGDGAARQEVEALMEPFGGRVRFLGALDPDGMHQAYRRSRVFLWPGVNEAFGMVYLEAQAVGVPVVAQDRPGVNEVVTPEGLCAADDPEALAGAVSHLLNDNAYHSTRALAAREHISSRHLMGAARQTLWDAIGPLISEAK
ncbi:glycosyltransferase involved in cell wall biosynthesis [Shimia isoporae]|uniref:Glycosyltransferase involved in cell wall biosynthesis n=1 Tax=Shimia isoporae TaxID=647720 RepID=A0A4R1N4C6_9RHOB|nr:glycosyltransferase family 4 protein [Shimia isoporae]TCL01516.1 glycosyltransferase involved in cell wall biosynthesis [Shimia isoporae]